MWLFYYFNFARSYDALKSKSPCFLMKKILTLIKTKLNQQIENLTQCFRDKPCSSANKRIAN